MPYTVEDYQHELALEILSTLKDEDDEIRLAGMSDERRFAGIPDERRLAGIPSDRLREMLNKRLRQEKLESRKNSKDKP